MTDTKIDERRGLLIDALENLNRQYQKVAQPFLEELARLESMAGLEPYVVTRGQWVAFMQPADQTLPPVELTAAPPEPKLELPDFWKSAKCEICGAPAVTQVFDLMETEDAKTGMRKVRHDGGAHLFCDEHKRESQRTKIGPMWFPAP